MAAKVFKIHKDGLIQGGSCWYDYVPGSGVITYWAEVKVGTKWLSKKYATQGTLTVSASLMKYEQIDEVGEVSSHGNVEVRCFETGPGWSRVNVRFLDTDVSGVALVRDDAGYLEILEATLNGSFAGMNLRIRATRI